MKIIIPVDINDTTLTATDVTELDQPDWALATGYLVGDVIQITTPDIHTVYECIQAHTSDATNKPNVDVDPNTGIGTYWIRISATNTWAMFSDQISDQTEKAVDINVTVTPGSVFNALALFNLDGTEVVVQVDDPVDGIVYDETISLTDNGGINDWYEYYFDPIYSKQDIALTDLPPYANADVNVTINAPAGTAKCGLMTLGYQQVIGVTEHGTNVGIIDYTRKELDSFGRPIIVEGNFSKTANYRILVQTNRIDFIQNLLVSLRANPVTWIGSEQYGSTIIYGYYRDFDLLFRSPDNSPCSIEVEGLT